MVQQEDDLSWAGKPWSFGGTMPKMFQDHVRRNIPGYLSAHDTVEELVVSLLRSERKATVVDFGCSDGRLLRRLSEKLPEKSSRLIGLDVEPNMVSVAAEACESPNVEFRLQDLRGFGEQFDIGICLFTLQFVPRAERLRILLQIRKNLTPGGALFFFEKVYPESEVLGDLVRNSLHRWKIAQGYTMEEVQQKDKSLEGLMEPLSERENRELLRNAGFLNVQTIWARAPFVGWLAML